MSGAKTSDPSASEATRIKTVALVGAGLIGTGWATIFSRARRNVRVFDVDHGQLSRFHDRVRAALDQLVASGWADAAATGSSLARISVHATLAEAVSGAEYVQESVAEDLALKRAVFNDLDLLTGPEVVLGSSVSTIPMTEIAAETRHPDRCIVVHPTNPPHIVPFVELVPGERTAPWAVSRALALMKDIGQSPIVCHKEIFGFVINRLQFALEREAFFLARAGIASVEDIDLCITEGLGLRWALIGPFAVEETNADSIESDLTKFGPTIGRLMAEVCQPFAQLSLADLAMASNGVQYALRTRTHNELIQYRDRLVLAIRSLKATEAQVVGDRSHS